MCRKDEVDEVPSSTTKNDPEGNDDSSPPSPVPNEEQDESASSDPLTKPRKEPHKEPPTYRINPSEYDTFMERYSVRVANRPCLNFWLSFFICLGLGMIGIIVGDFSVEVDNAGWYSRGTLISNRQQQYWLVDTYREALFTDTTGDVWNTLETEKQVQVNSDDDDDNQGRRSLVLDEERARSSNSWSWATLGSQWKQSLQFLQGKHLQDRAIKGEFAVRQDHRRRAMQGSQLAQDWLARRLQDVASNQDSLGPLEGCDVTWYNSSALFDESRLWPVWKNKMPNQMSLWDGPALEEMCEKEAITQAYLEKVGLCMPCGEGSGRCLAPYSPVLFARMTVDNGLTLSCADLATAWSTNYQAPIEESVVSCVEAIKTDYNPDRDGATLPSQACPVWFFPHMLDENYENNQNDVTFASSIFATRYEDIDALYDAVDNFGYGEKYSETSYDTQNEDLVVIAMDEQVLTDMGLAVGSAGITLIAMVVHTRSPFLALVGLLQIVLSFPVAYFFYVFVARLRFFPFLNFIGIFVIFALGADDVFVAVDKWKNARIARPDAPPEEIAAKAFPDAAGAMLLTTLTTAVAFFGTCVCPVSPILAFACFVGLLVVFDYVLCCLLVFPALVIYDNRLRAQGRTNCCCQCGFQTCCCCLAKHKSTHGENSDDTGGEGREQEDSHTPSLIHRILDRYYTFLHRLRWPLLVVCAGALIVSAIKAAKIELPRSADVRLFEESDNQFEANYIQRQNLLFDVIENKVGSTTDVIWGVLPRDTGNHNNPDSWTKLVLDRSFEPSREEVQEFLRDFCDRFFSEEFATPVRTGYECPMERLDQWLKEQAAADTPEGIYTDYCAGATQLPIPQTSFDKCAYSWSQAYGVDNMLAKEGKITIMTIRFNSRVRFDSPQAELEDEWNEINDWMMNNKGPEGSGSPYFTSEDFWWFDTNAVMLETACK